MSNVKIYRHNDYGAPTLYGAAGYLIGVLDACLVDGYGQQTIITMTHSNGIVTAATGQAHGLQPHSRQTVAGANEAGYNGEYIITIIDAFSFYYTASGISTSPATGTITIKSAGAGWTKAYSGTNLAAYRQGGGNQHYLHINDTYTGSARCIGYEAMSAVSTGTGPFPTTAQMNGGLYWQKANTTDAINFRDWVIVADDKTIYMWVRYTTGTDYGAYSFMGFGDYYSYKAGDQYNTFLSANSNNGSYQYQYFPYLVSNLNSILSTSLFYMYSARNYTQVGSSVPQGKMGDYSKAAQSGMGFTGTGMPYPNPVDGGLYMCPVTVGDGIGVAAQAVLRGRMYGIWNPLHSVPLNNGDIFEGNGELAGRTFMAFTVCPATTNFGQLMLEISPTWT